MERPAMEQHADVSSAVGPAYLGKFGRRSVCTGTCIGCSCPPGGRCLRRVLAEYGPSLRPFAASGSMCDHRADTGKRAGSGDVF
jgi:hypothetical protein